MTDPAVREIQLSRKQLAFGVISAVGVSVVIFLLGVSVGRGVLATSASATAAVDRGAPADATDAAVSSAPPASADASDHTSASGSAGTGANAIAMKVAEPPSPPPEVPATDAAATKVDPAKSDAPAKADAAPSKAPTPKPAPVSSAAPVPAHAAPKPDAQKPASPAAAAHSDWVVTVDSFKSMENAERLVGKLKAAGYTTFISTAPAPSGLHRVRIGPFTDRAEADKTVSRLLKEGYHPSLTH